MEDAEPCMVKRTSWREKKRLADKSAQVPNTNQRTYTITDHRLEKPNIAVRQVRKGGKVTYEVSGDLSAPVPPIRESKYLNKNNVLRSIAGCC